MAIKEGAVGTEQTYRRVSRSFVTPGRLQLLTVLHEGPMIVNDLVAVLGFSQPSVSKHLRVLRENGLAAFEQKRNMHLYSITDNIEGRSIRLMIDTLNSALQNPDSSH
jgi:DNA-binding transcriptional ArsR family regulator